MSIKLEGTDVIDSLAVTVDNKLDEVVGIRPIEAVSKIAKKIAPANAIEEITGTPKPNTVLSQVQDRIERDIDSTKMRPPF